MEPARVISRVDAAGPRPVVAGTDIKVSQIATEYEELGMDPDEIVEAHPHLTLADVHAALAYYYENPARIRKEWAEGRALEDSIRRRHAASSSA